MAFRPQEVTGDFLREPVCTLEYVLGSASTGRLSYRSSLVFDIKSLLKQTHGRTSQGGPKFDVSGLALSVQHPKLKSHVSRCVDFDLVAKLHGASHHPLEQ